MYHRIVSPEKTGEYLEPGMYVTPETFAMHCTLLKRYFDVVSLSEIILKNRTCQRKPLCALTFDDGWRDFYINAFPVLSLNKLQSTVYLPTDYIGTEERFWTDHLAMILKNVFVEQENLVYSGDDSRIRQILNCKGDLAMRVDAAIKQLKPYSAGQIKEIMRELAKTTNFSAQLERAFLSWDEVRMLKNTGLVTFGSHTAGHLILTSEKEDVVTQELIHSREKLLQEQAVDPQFISFCYPNGGFSEAIAKNVKMAGYNCAVTTKRGWNSNKSDLFTLKRVGMHQDMTGSKSLTLAKFGGGKTTARQRDCPTA